MEDMYQFTTEIGSKILAGSERFRAQIYNLMLWWLIFKMKVNNGKKMN